MWSLHVDQFGFPHGMEALDILLGNWGFQRRVSQERNEQKLHSLYEPRLGGHRVAHLRSGHKCLAHIQKEGA